MWGPKVRGWALSRSVGTKVPEQPTVGSSLQREAGAEAEALSRVTAARPAAGPEAAAPPPLGRPGQEPSRAAPPRRAARPTRGNHAPYTRAVSRGSYSGTRSHSVMWPPTPWHWCSPSMSAFAFGISCGLWCFWT